MGEIIGRTESEIDRNSESWIKSSARGKGSQASKGPFEEERRERTGERFGESGPVCRTRPGEIHGSHRLTK
jgi:hypothetical protein